MIMLYGVSGVFVLDVVFVVEWFFGYIVGNVVTDVSGNGYDIIFIGVNVVLNDCSEVIVFIDFFCMLGGSILICVYGEEICFVCIVDCKFVQGEVIGYCGDAVM